jgi:hypothetical protein
MLLTLSIVKLSHDVSVTTATHYGLGRISNPGEGEISRTYLNRPWGPPSPLYNGYQLFPRVKRPGRGVAHPHQSSAEVKDRVELYRYFTSGP